MKIRVAEPHHFYAALAPGKNYDVALSALATAAPALAPTLPVTASAPCGSGSATLMKIKLLYKAPHNRI
jgi:hypothetical protein